MSGGRKHSLGATAAAAALVGLSSLRKNDPQGGDPEERQRDAAAQETGRGRGAESPLAIPRAGWKDILMRTYGQLSKDRVMLVAAGVTFYALLALFPALTAMISIYGMFADPETVVGHVEEMSGFLPGGAVDVIGEQMRRVASQPAGQLSFGFIAGLAIALWSANNGMKAIFDATNVAYNEREKRSFVQYTLQSLGFTLAALFVVILILAAFIVLPIVFNFLGIGEWAETALMIGRWPVLMVIIAGGISLIYRYGPSREPAEWRWIWLGSITATVIWAIVSVLFSWYVSNFGSYNETYGSLGAAIGFMVWIWVSATVVIMGAELNSETERQTRIDSTTGEPKPMGSRGAQAADTLGEKFG